MTRRSSRLRLRAGVWKRRSGSRNTPRSAVSTPTESQSARFASRTIVLSFAAIPPCRVRLVTFDIEKPPGPALEGPEQHLRNDPPNARYKHRPFQQAGEHLQTSELSQELGRLPLRIDVSLRISAAVHLVDQLLDALPGQRRDDRKPPAVEDRVAMIEHENDATAGLQHAEDLMDGPRSVRGVVQNAHAGDTVEGIVVERQSLGIADPEVALQPHECEAFPA